MNKSILIVDDHIKLYKSLARNFDDAGYASVHARNGVEALELFSSQLFDVVLLDIMLGQDYGIELLEQLKLLHADIPIIMITGNGTIDTAVQSIKLGAFDYVTKPLQFTRLLEIVQRALQTSRPAETASAENAADGTPHLCFIARSRAMYSLCNTARKLAATDLPVLILGENGTGKEVLADFIHMHSPRKALSMVKINCAAFPDSLLDNELFGHEKGAYTGADSSFRGVFERADKSSLFLDEIGDMPLTIQAKILRTLQNREIRRIGGETGIQVDVRFIAATNKNLEQMIDDKAFREDLFYRLNTAVITLPAIRDRKDDVPALMQQFLSDFAKDHHKSAKTFDAAVMEFFMDYHWPGNVRELKNALHYAAAMASGPCITLDDLPPHYHNAASPAPTDKNIREYTEKTLILKMLHKTDNNKKQTAKLLGMSRNTLYSKMEKYDIGSHR